MVRQLTEIEPAAITEVLGAYDGSGTAGGYRWDGPVPVRVDEETFRDAWLTTYRERVREAIQSLAGDRSDPARAPLASEACRTLMTVAANALTLSQVAGTFVESDFFDLLVSRLAVVPIGSASMPYWYNRPHRTLAYLVRTREKDVETGEPSYNLRTRPLSETSATALEREIARGRRRITVSRVALLAPTPTMSVPGLNLMVLQVGDWLESERRGLLTGSESDEDAVRPYVRARLRPPELLDYENTVVAPGRAGAHRTLDWLASASTWLAAGTEVEADGWVARVRDLAAAVADDDVPLDAGWRQLAAVLGRETAVRLRAGGFGRLRDVDPDWYPEAIDVLFASGSSPASSTWLDEHGAAVAARIGDVFAASGDGRWDVAPVTEEAEAAELEEQAGHAEEEHA